MGRRSRSANRPANRPDDAVPRASGAAEDVGADAAGDTLENSAAAAADAAADEGQPSRLRRRAQLLRELDRAKTVRARLSPVGDGASRLRRPLRHV